MSCTSAQRRETKAGPPSPGTDGISVRISSTSSTLMGDFPWRWMWRKSWTTCSREISTSRGNRIWNRSYKKIPKSFNTRSMRKLRTVLFWIQFNLLLKRLSPITNLATHSKKRMLSYQENTQLQSNLLSWRKPWPSSLKSCESLIFNWLKINNSWPKQSCNSIMLKINSITPKSNLLVSQL